MLVWIYLIAMKIIKMVDLIFIDAGHETPQVTEDIKLWYPKINSNGFFSGDDYFYPPVRKAVNDFVNETGNELYNSRGTNNNHGPWSWYIIKN